MQRVAPIIPDCESHSIVSSDVGHPGNVPSDGQRANMSSQSSDLDVDNPIVPVLKQQGPRSYPRMTVDSKTGKAEFQASDVVQAGDMLDECQQVRFPNHLWDSMV